jgi:membrane-bound serine protease (ClpP class)
VIFLVSLLIAFFVVPDGWTLPVIVVGVVIELTETGFVLWWSQRRKASVGVEALVGRRAVAVARLEPSGQVKLDGELWQAQSTRPVERGQEVVVQEVDGLTLRVSPPPADPAQ